MKKLIGLSLIAAVMVPVAAQAAASRGELYRDRQDIREERHEYHDAQRYGSPRDVREERGEYRDARREYREDVQDWRHDRRPGYHRGYPAFRSGWHAQPRAYGQHRWVRRHHDALLIDIRDGSVRRVIRGFYW
jgi:Ni/Co efflux regulator RcnB